MMDPRRLSRLRAITQLRYTSLQTEMADIAQKEAGLEENLAHLVAARTSRNAAVLDQSDTALIAGADIRWHRWMEERRGVINAELAQIRARKAGCAARLQQAFAQDQAVLSLHKRAVRAQKKTRERRAAYES